MSDTAALTLADLTVGAWSRDGFTTEVKARGAFDCIVNPCGRKGCGSNPGSGHGRGGLHFYFWLLGPDGGVEFDLFTNFDLPETPRSHREPDGGAVFVHAREPWYPEQDRNGVECKIARADYCYSDGSYLAGTEAWDVLLRRGTDGLWAFLAEWYDDKVGPAK